MLLTFFSCLLKYLGLESTKFIDPDFNDFYLEILIQLVSGLRSYLIACSLDFNQVLRHCQLAIPEQAAKTKMLLVVRMLEKHYIHLLDRKEMANTLQPPITRLVTVLLVSNS